MKPRLLVGWGLLLAMPISPALADGILMSWSPQQLRGMTEQKWEAAKRESVEDVLEANKAAATWPDAYLCLVGASQHTDDKTLLLGLVSQLTDATERSLTDTNRLIVWERITTGEILFEGEGIQIEDDVYTAAGRANWILRSVTKKNFGYVKPKPSVESLHGLQATWIRWLAGEDVQEYSTPFPSAGKGLEEIRSLAALEALIVSFKPSTEKNRVTSDCLRNVYHLDKLPTEPDAPGRLCSPDPWIRTYLAKLTDVPEEHDATWWSAWWQENKSVLNWDSGTARFEVRKTSDAPTSLSNKVPSTLADRTRAVETAHALENDPLGATAADGRAWVLAWLGSAPDVTVNVCLELIDPLLKSKKPDAAALAVQLAITSGAFVIEHPEQATDDAVVSRAGLLGVLRAYERIVAQHPKSQISFLDDLRHKRDNGELAAFVSKGLAKCAKDK